MTVGQLIKELQSLNEPDRIVILSSDAEGNSYSPLEAYFTAKYNDGEVGLEKITPEDRKLGYSDEDVMRGGNAAVVFIP